MHVDTLQVSPIQAFPFPATCHLLNLAHTPHLLKIDNNLKDCEENLTQQKKRSDAGLQVCCEMNIEAWGKGVPGRVCCFVMHPSHTYLNRLAWLKTVLHNLFPLAKQVYRKFCGAHYEILRQYDNEKIKTWERTKILKAHTLILMRNLSFFVRNDKTNSRLNSRQAYT